MRCRCVEGNRAKEGGPPPLACARCTQMCVRMCVCLCARLRESCKKACGNFQFG